MSAAHRFCFARAAMKSLPPGNHIDLELCIGGRYVRNRQPQFAPNDIAALCEGAGFVERDLAIAALASKAAVVRRQLIFPPEYTLSALRISAATSSGRSA